MVTDILPYVISYDNVRGALGMPDDELSDEVLALPVFASTLGFALIAKEGVYAPSTESQNLEEIFAAIDDTDPMYQAIQMYSTYVVAEAVAANIGLWAVKTKADGKSTITRFSAESTYEGTRLSVFNMKKRYLEIIYELLGIEPGTAATLRVVPPSTDLVTGETS